MDGYVNVAVRIKPVFSDSFLLPTISLISVDPWVLEVDHRLQYKVDHVFTEDVGQTEIHNKLVRPLIKKVQSGYNSTVFAYGQTGTGKTYTIGSNTESYDFDEPGLILRSITDFISCLDSNAEIYISFFEIYNEKIYDLLHTNKTILPIKGTQDLIKEKLFSLTQAKSILKRGSANRHVGETKQNIKSSRSHAILTIHYCCEGTFAKLNLVDLAGSESVKRTGSKGNQFQEGVNINKGLLSIGRVINALATNGSFIPYRESKITSILQDSLSKDNYVTLIACVSPHQQDIRETIQTLDFTQETKKIKNKPEQYNLLSSRKKTNLFKRSNHHIPQNLFSIKKTKMIDMACSPIKPRNFLNSEIYESTGPANESIHFGSEFCLDNLSPIIEKCVQKELSSNSKSNFRSTPIALKNRLSTCEETHQFLSENYERNTFSPYKFSMDVFEEIVSQSVHNEFVKVLNKNSKATSSSPHCSEQETVCASGELKNTEEYFNFKVPEIPSVISVQKKKTNFRENKNKSNSLEISESKNPLPSFSINRESYIESPKTPSPNSDKFCWKKLENLVARSIRREIIALKNQKSLSPTMTYLGKYPKKLHFENQEQLERSQKSLKKKMSPEKQNDYLCQKNIVTRRSLRILSNFSNELTNNSLEFQPRRSVRLSLKPPLKFNSHKQSLHNEKEKEQRRNKCHNKQKDAKKKVDTYLNTIGSPKSNHREHVLYILNNGSESELRKLATVGPKTASKIYLYRTLNGKFGDISDLPNVTGIWRGTELKRFFTENFINN